jgi:hypothetical protein
MFVLLYNPLMASADVMVNQERKQTLFLSWRGVVSYVFVTQTDRAWRSAHEFQRDPTDSGRQKSN